MGAFLFYLYALTACGGAIAVVLSQNVVRMAFWLVISLSSTALLFFLLDADFVAATQLLIYVGGTVVLLIFGVMLTSSGPYSTTQSSPAEMLQSGIIALAFLALVSSTVFSVDWEANEVKLASASTSHGESASHGEHESDHHHADVNGAGHSHSHADRQISGFNPSHQGNTTRSLGTALLGVRFDKDLNLSSTDGPDHAQDHHGEDAHDEDHHGHSHGGEPSHVDDASPVSTGYLLPFEIVSVHLLVVLVGAAYLARAKRRVVVQDA